MVVKVGKLLLQRDFSRFLKDENLQHKFNIWYKSKKLLTCSGLLLAQQSSIFEEMICGGKCDLIIPDVEILTLASVKECLRYLYGADVQLDRSNIVPVILFSSIYGIWDLVALSFNWIRGHLDEDSTLDLFNVLHLLDDKFRSVLSDVLHNHVANHIVNVIAASWNALNDGKCLQQDLILAIMVHSPPRCGDLVLKWIGMSPENGDFLVIHFEEKTDLLLKHFPDSKTFTELISCLSSTVTAVKIMEKLIKLQQTYYMIESSDETINTVTSDDSRQTLVHSVYNITGKGFISLKLNCDLDQVVCVANIPAFSTEDDVLKSLNIGRAVIEDSVFFKVGGFTMAGFVGLREPESLECVINSKTFLFRSVLSVKVLTDIPQTLTSGKRLFIKNIPMKASKTNVERPFRICGGIKEIEIIRHKCCAFIEFHSSGSVGIALHLSANGIKFNVLKQKVQIEQFKVKK